jgi:CheY-like chemotaxis protein
MPDGTVGAFNPGEFVIMFVEDEPVVQTVVGVTLRRQGYQLLESGTGEQALEMSRRYGQDIHLLITDYYMPGITGLELAATLRSERPTMKVLVISGNTAEDIVRRNSNLDFLRKPFLPAELSDKVRQMLRTNSSSPQIM